MIFTVSRKTLSTSRTRKPAAATLATVSRSVSGPTRRASGLISRIMTLKGNTRLPVCSNMCSSPPGLSTRRTFSSASIGLGTEQKVQDVNT